MRFKINVDKYKLFGYNISSIGKYKVNGNELHEWTHKIIYKKDTKIWEAQSEYDSWSVLREMETLLTKEVEKSVELKYDTFAFEDINLTLTHNRGELFGQEFLFNDEFQVIRYGGKTYIANDGIGNAVKEICKSMFDEVDEFFNIEFKE